MRTRDARAHWLALGAITLLACVLAAGCWRVYSNTWDEPEHLAAGVELLDRGLYQYDTEHPPLGRILLALPPYLAGAHSFGTPPPDGTREGIDILYSGGHYWRTLTLARLGTLAFLPLLMLATWLWARRLLPAPGAALLPVVLLASVPAVLAHAGLASLDVAAAATGLLALYCLQRWVASGRYPEALWFGLSAGIAVTTKFSAVPFLGLALLLLPLAQWLLPRPGAPQAPPTGAHRLGGLLLAALAALGVVFLVYGPRASDPYGVALRYDWAVSYLLQRPGFAHMSGVLFAHLPLPRELKDLVNGFVAVEAHNDSGHRSYLLGEVRLGGWWYFYLVTLAVKTPLPLLVAGLTGLAWLARDGWRRGDSWRLAPPVLALAILIFASTFSRINIGVRHVLILYPFLALGAACLGMLLWQHTGKLATPRARQLGRAALLLAFVWQLSALCAYPDYLPYFNIAVRDPDYVLADSDVDWGQDLYRLEQRASQLHIAHLSLAYRGTADLAQEPLPPLYVLPPHHPVSGWVAISQLARTREGDDYAWLRSWRPLERIGKTIDLYYIP